MTTTRRERAGLLTAFGVLSLVFAALGVDPTAAVGAAAGVAALLR